MATYTVYDIIKSATQICGATAYGESIPAELSDQAILILNGMRAEWSLKHMNNKIFDVTYTALTNKQYISLGTDIVNGTSGDILIRPTTIDQVTVIMGQVNITIPTLSFEEYRQLSLQNMFSVPSYAYVDTESPIRNVYFYPGLQAGYQVRFNGLSQLSDYTNISDIMIDPPEYFQAMYTNLALRLAPLLGVTGDVMTGMVQAAAVSLKAIKASNFKNRMQRSKNDLYGNSVNGGFNFFGGL